MSSLQRAERPVGALWARTVYFMSGLPATVVVTMATILFSRLGVSDERIAFYSSALVLPWIIRPLWSPLLEVYKTRRFFIVVTEAGMGLSLAGVAGALFMAHPVSLCVCLFAAVGFLAATHDMAADGLFVATVPVSEQAEHLGWMGLAFNLAKLTTQGLAVILAGSLERPFGFVIAWQISFACLALVSGLLALFHARWLPPDVMPRPSAAQSMAVTTSAVLQTFWAKRGVVWLVAVVALYRFSEGQLARIGPLFFLRDTHAGGLGISTVQLGTFYSLGIGGVIVGAFLASKLSVRMGLTRSILWFCVAFNLPTVLYALLAFLRPASPWLVASSIVLEHFAYGVGSIGLKLVMLQVLAVGPYSTSHIAIAAAISGIGSAAGGMISGVLESAVGFRMFFVWTVLASLPSIVAAKISSRDWPAVSGQETRLQE